mmetsp:Transcript_24586/g.48873  ORF Transcript_24586/g.48873 Transcript_24586/m.48873 type:complete len:153 (-) Transcript_24586:51-509(-)
MRLGCDLASISRIQSVFSKHGSKFLGRILHATEIETVEALPEAERARFLAMRWAAKEATYKAFGSWRVPFPEIQVDKVRHVAPQVPGLPPPCADRMAPQLVFHGSTAALAHYIGVTDAQLTLSHEGDSVLAVVGLRLESTNPDQFGGSGPSI